MDPLLSALGVFLIVVAVTAVTSAVALGVHALRSLIARRSSKASPSLPASSRKRECASRACATCWRIGRPSSIAVNERLDSVTHHLSQSKTTNRQHTLESLQKLNERLAVIDHAQKNITDLAANMSSLHSVLANKQQRGAFGRGRLEIIVKDGLPRDCYEFQFTLSNKSRPDCAVFLPDGRPLAIDAKFPLEAVTALRDAKSDDERKQAAARLRQDFARHLGDISEKYLIPGETQDLALMFVPSESVYVEL